MNIGKRAASCAVAIFLVVATLGGSAAAFGADNVASLDEVSLLPQSVRDAAVDEAQSPSDYHFIPEIDASISPPATDLASLVKVKSADVAIDQEEKCLASAIYYEARSEPFEGQLAVAQVILNRVRSGRFAETICGVVLQRSQFSFVRGGTIPNISAGSKDWREALAIARIAQARLHPSAAAGALFFHATHVNPKWRLNRVASIGNHIFYR
jgi:spore germination cell wall hydrolase CwlJ-like protein